MRLLRIIYTALLAGASAMLAPARALATYSIVAADTTTKQVGAAGTSCVGSALSVYVIYGSAPGKGVVAAQAQINQAGRDQAVLRLAQSEAPASIIAALTAPGFDVIAASRQYGIVDVTGRSAGYTGQSNQSFADDRQGQTGSFSYSAQGNILTSAAVLDQAAAAFETTGCDLADKLILALEAGAKNGQGDKRCTPRGVPSDGAFIQVDLPTGAAGSYLKLTVNNTGNRSPLTPLRQQYDVWRQAHPCAARDAGVAGAAGTGGSAGTGGGAGTGGSAGTGGVAGSAGSGGLGGVAAAGGAATGDASAGSSPGGRAGSSPGGSGASGQRGTTTPASDADDGCACRTERGTAGNALGAALLLSLLTAMRLRGRNRARRYSGALQVSPASLSASPQTAAPLRR